ncbi:MAG TPA: hypothetical protein VFQ53_16670 [Kofleriaceae bacterium]|nr:hypothetical protein [Kofleriaceae bacterium]
MSVLAIVAMVASCKKDSGSSNNNSNLPADMKPQPVVVDPGKLHAPALFANVPADAPYVVGAFEAVPLDYYAKMKTALAPTFANMAQLFRDMDSTGKPSLISAVMQEMDGKWNAQGLESLGFSSQPRFALYGLGLLPVVFRIEVKDQKTLLATIERVAKQAGQSLPPMEQKDGRTWWRLHDAKMDVLVALADNQLVFALGPPARIDANLGLILGSEKPAQSMADGKALTEVMTRHGFGPHLIGFVDTKRLATAAFAYDGRQMTPACSTQIDAFATAAPRVVIGYAEISPKRASGGVVVELSQTLIKELAALKTEVPGLAQAVADQPMLAFGGGIDLPAAHKLGQRAVAVVGGIGQACDLEVFREASADLGEALGRPLPDPLAKVVGAVFAVKSVQMSKSMLPEKAEAFGLLATTDGKAFVEDMMKEQPALRRIGLETDGKLHPVGQGMLPLPFEVKAGVGGKNVVVAIGAQGEKLATETIDAKGGGKVPFLVATYDYGKFMELNRQITGGFDPDDALSGGKDPFTTVFGRTVFSIDVNDKGLVGWGTVEMK